MTGVPLVIDLDGTLLRSDLLQESTLKLLATAPQHLLSLPGWLYTGKAHLKRQVAERVTLDIAKLPYDDKLIAWIEDERLVGPQHRAVLGSDSTSSAGADHLGLFDEVIASDGVTTSRPSARRLWSSASARRTSTTPALARRRAGRAQARRAVLVSPNAGVRSAAARVATIEREFGDGRAGLRSWVAALRLHQWAKNLLIFLPLLASHRFEEVALIRSALLAFFAFGLCASSVYVLNDLMDLEADRHHPRKRLRAFASGALSPQAGLWVCATLLLAALWIGWQVGPAFTVWLDIYCVDHALNDSVEEQDPGRCPHARGPLHLRSLRRRAVGIWPGYGCSRSRGSCYEPAFVKRFRSAVMTLRKAATARRPDYLTPIGLSGDPRHRLPARRGGRDGAIPTAPDSGAVSKPGRDLAQ